MLSKEQKPSLNFISRKQSNAYLTTETLSRFELEPSNRVFMQGWCAHKAYSWRTENTPAADFAALLKQYLILTNLQHNNDMLIHRLFSLFFFQVGMADCDQLIASCVLLYRSTTYNCSNTRHVLGTRTNTNIYLDSKQTWLKRGFQFSSAMMIYWSWGSNLVPGLLDNLHWYLIALCLIFEYIYLFRSRWLVFNLIASWCEMRCLFR